MKQIIRPLPWLLSLVLAATAFAQTSTNITNSTVRFRIGYGFNFFGDIDVQLFDQDKPNTVSNFLAYAQSNQYRNTLLHRCVPQFILQGGQWSIPTPYSTNVFQSVTRIPTGPAFANEFNVGTNRSNVLGTIAIGKAADGTNSAAGQWFFNLGNNNGTGSRPGPNLDALDGGYTVFGKVTAGTNVLEYFNTIYESHGILNLTNPLAQKFCLPIRKEPDGVSEYFLDALPVASTQVLYCPLYTELFTVQILMLNARDVLPPSVAVTAPKLYASVTNQDVRVTGTVNDNVSVGSVSVYWTTNPPLAAAVTNGKWSLTLTNVPAGTNLILVEAVDRTGNRAQITHSFFRSVRAPLELLFTGQGGVTGATNQQLLEVGRGYTLIARPARLNLFTGWTGDHPQASPTLNFIMASNTSLTAVFATNLFPNVRGTYRGLFYNLAEVEQPSSGYLTLTVGDLGTYTTKVLMNGKSYGARGTFDVEGKTTNVVLRPGTNALRLTLELDLTGGTDQLIGTVTNNQVTAVDTNHGWSADLTADRTLFNLGTNPTSFAGRYTAIVPFDTNNPAGPDGDGFATVRVSSAGGITLALTLADGTKASQATTLSKEGLWPLYVPLYQGKGAAVSWVNFTTNVNESDFNGRLNWFKQQQDTARYYPGGFTNEIDLIGSRFVAPPKTNGVLTFTNAVVAFTNGNLAADFTNGVTLAVSGKATNLGSNRLSLKISRSSGLFSGSVTPPNEARSRVFHGAVLQKQDLGSGFILGTNRTGRVTLTP